MTEQEGSAETREQIQKESVPQNGAGTQSKPEAKIEPTPPQATTPIPVAAHIPIPAPTPNLDPTRSPAAPLVRRRALVRCKGVMCVPGKPEIITFAVGRDFWPERIVLHHLCVRGLLISDIRVRREGSTDMGASKLDGEGELIGEAFIASIAENHTPDLGKVEKNGAVDLHVKNIAPTPVMVHGHIHGFVMSPDTSGFVPNPDTSR